MPQRQLLGLVVAEAALERAQSLHLDVGLFGRRHAGSDLTRDLDALVGREAQEQRRQAIHGDQGKSQYPGRSCVYTLDMRTMVIAATLCAAVAQAPAQEKAKQPESAATVVARVQRYYDATKDLRAKFEQQIESASRAPSKAAGEVLLKKPGKMRWDYARPEKKLMVSDGATLWVYEPEDEQAYKQDLKGNALPAQVSFLLGEGKLDKEFDASFTKVDALTPGDLALKMVPKVGTAAYRYLVFVVDGKTGQVKQTIIYGQDGSTNRLTFADVQQNKGVDDGKFKFAPPAGTHILKPPAGP